MTSFPDKGLKLKGMSRRVQIGEVRRFCHRDDVWFYLNSPSGAISFFLRDGAVRDLFIDDDDLATACSFYLRHDLSRAFRDLSEARARAIIEGFLSA